MKTTQKPLSLFCLVLAGVSLSLWPAHAGQVVVTDFDSADDPLLWSNETWSDPATTEFDAQNAGGGADGSGSMKVTFNFPERPTGYSQSVVSLSLGQEVDAEMLYTNISMDVKLDPLSFPRVDGTNYGALEMIFRNGPTDWNSLGSHQLTLEDTNWVHLNFPVKAPGDKVHHLTIKLGENNLTNTVIIYVDNIRWDEATVQIPPPTMFIDKTTPGLNLQAASTGQYDRQNIATLTGDYGWIGSSEPMSYSMTIKEFPSGVAYSGFSAHWYIYPGSATGDAPDWSEGSVVLVDVQANATDGGTATFHYKTNAPNSNGINNQFFNTDPTNGPVGQLGSVTGASILGTWTVTLKQDTNIVLTAPDGTTNSFNMPPEDAAQFAGGATVYFGIMPGQTVNIGQSAVLSSVQIKSGNNVVLEDDFSTGELNPDKWVVKSASAAGVSLVPPGQSFYVSWTTPASGFVLQTNSLLSVDGVWGDVGITDQLVGTKKRVLVPAASLPGTSMGFFRLNKPAQ